MKHIIKNVLTNKERKKLIKDCQPHLLDSEEMGRRSGKASPPRYPGKQTLGNIHVIPCFTSPIEKIARVVADTVREDLILSKSWINWSTGKKTDMGWHTHPVDYSAVYYIKTFPLFSNGTLFEEGLFKAPQNSVLIFPSYLMHSAPSSPLRFSRYTLALDLTRLNQW
tara:strand:+ start:183 stop:683 length:501 start_codon:yes stop_codon:yes gene_type:complete